MHSPTTFVRCKVAAGYLGVSCSMLAKLRMQGNGPVYMKAGHRIVLYNMSDLDAWLAGRRRYSTSQVSAAEMKLTSQSGE